MCVCMCVVTGESYRLPHPCTLCRKITCDIDFEKLGTARIMQLTFVPFCILEWKRNLKVNLDTSLSFFRLREIFIKMMDFFSKWYEKRRLRDVLDFPYKKLLKKRRVSHLLSLQFWSIRCASCIQIHHELHELITNSADQQKGIWMMHLVQG